MDMKPVHRKSVYEDIVLQIRSMIEEGTLTPGDKLPPERSLAEMLSVSRNTVREAIKVLAQQEILESRQGAGTFVREVVEGNDRAGFTDFFAGEKPDIRDVFEVRKLIEPEIAALAARHASIGDVAQLETVLAEQERAVRSGEYGSVHDQRLHGLLAKASGNAVLQAMISVLHEDLTASRSDELQSAERQKASLAAHRAIVEAVKNGHVMQAERAMRAHLDELEAIVFSNKI